MLITASNLCSLHLLPDLLFLQEWAVCIEGSKLEAKETIQEVIALPEVSKETLRRIIKGP